MQMSEAGTDRLTQGTPRGVDVIDLVTHELMTPLAVISTAVDTLSGQHELRPDQRAALLAAIRRHTDLLVALVGRLTALRDLQGGTLSLELEGVDLADLTRRLAADVAGVQDHAPSILVDAPVPVVVRADRPAVEQILVILLTNAVRHADEGAIHVSVGVDDGTAHVQVRDHGPGVDDAIRDAIFEPYVRGTTRGRGAGLGLTLGRGLAMAHGGTLRLGQTPSGGGSSFVLTLPIEHPTPASTSRPAPSAP